MSRLRSWLRINPIIVKELRSRMRGPRAFITLTVTLLLTAGLMYALLQLMLALSSYQTDILSSRIGQGLFTALAFLELAMICAITPAVTAGAISGEKEKLTFEMLQATPLSPARVLWGKLVSALSYVILLLFAGIPLASLVFIFGGVAPRDMLKVLVVLVVLAVSFGVLGLFFSALFGRTGRATVASFLVVLALTFVPLFVAMAVAVVRQGDPPRWLLAPSPVSMLSSVMGPAVTGNNVLGQIMPFLGGYWMQSAITPLSQTSIPRPLYHYAFPIYGGLTLILYLITTRLLQPAHRWRFKRKDIAIGLGLVLLFAGAVAGLFLGTANRYEWVKASSASNPATGSGVAIRAEPVQPGLGVTATAVVTGALSQEQFDAAAADIYAAVVRQVVTVDNTFGGQQKQFPLVYILNKSDDRAGDPSIQEARSASLPDALMKSVGEKLKDLGAEVRWADSLESVAKDPNTGVLKDEGAVVTLGNIYQRDDGTIQVAGSIYVGSLAGGGKTYVLEQINGVWNITGSTGSQWIS